MLRTAAFVAVWAVGVATWAIAGICLAKAARGATPGTSWWTRTNPLSPLTQPHLWSAESKKYWRLHYISIGVFIGLCALGIVLAEALPDN